MKQNLKVTWLFIFNAILLSCLSLVSCGEDSKDEPKEQSYEEMIVGIWSDDATPDWYDGGNTSGDAYGYEFKENGTCYVHGSNYGNGRYQIFDDQLVISYKSYAFNEVSTYTERYTIVKLTKNILELMDNDYYSFDTEIFYRIK